MPLSIQWSHYLLQREIPDRVWFCTFKRIGIDWEEDKYLLNLEVSDWCQDHLSGVPYFHYYWPHDYENLDEDDYPQLLLMFNCESDITAFKLMYAG